MRIEKLLVVSAKVMSEEQSCAVDKRNSTKERNRGKVATYLSM